MTDVPRYVSRNIGVLGALRDEERRRREKKPKIKFDSPTLVIVWGLEETAPRAFVAESKPGDRQRLQDWFSGNEGRDDVLKSLLRLCGNVGG